MSQADEQTKGKRDRIARLRERLKQATAPHHLAAIINGILDLLGDEL